MIILRIEDQEGFGMYNTLADEVGLARVEPPAHQPGVYSDKTLNFLNIPQWDDWKFGFASFQQYKNWCKGFESRLAECGGILTLYEAEEWKASEYQAVFHELYAQKIAALSPLITEEAFLEFFDELTSS